MAEPALQSVLLPEPSPLSLCPDGQTNPMRTPPRSAVKYVRTALKLFRKRIPAVFADQISTGSSNSPHAEDMYDGMADPWWILCHMNLYTAEMKMTHHRPTAYETAVSCARAVVGMVRRM